MGESHQQFGTMAANFLAAIAAGDQVMALVLVREALATGLSLCDLYLHVLQPALYEIGQLWERGQIDVASEHLATAITRSVMDECASLVRSVPQGPPLILATCVGPELHDLGLRMVVDCLELANWPTLYLGSNMPLQAIVSLAVQKRVAVVLASVTMGRYIPQVRDLTRTLRQSPIGATVKILVGGQPFHRIPELWQQVGADGTAQDAGEAVAWVNRHASRERERG